MATITQKSTTDTGFQFTRKRFLSTVLVLIGLFALIQSNSTFDSTTSTTLALESGASGTVLEVDIPTLTFMLVMSSYFVIVGVLGIIDLRPLHRLTTSLLIAAGVMLFPTIIIAAVGDGRTNAITLITESLRLSTPIAIGAMAGIWCERAGVINIAIEGMMLFAACFGFTALFLMRGWFPNADINTLLFVSVLVAILTGGVVALLHAWLSITFATDQIVSGTVINILALGSTSFIRREVLLSATQGIDTLPIVRIPFLVDIPIIGEALFANKPIYFMMFVVIILTHVVLFHTKWGLRTRSVGENPHAADTLGINVNRMRWINVFIGGLVAGLAGAWFTLEIAGRFNDGMTDGKGFIALAAMIFGKWTPFGAFGGALLFGFADALGTRFQIIDVPIPPQFLQMVPYIVTMIVLAGLVGRAIPPRAVGQPYKKE
jgi:general nucleoside transport system permease protein